MIYYEYDTNYTFTDKATKEILYRNTGISCFAQWVSTTFNDAKCGFAPGRTMEIFSRTSNMRNDEYEIEYRTEIVERFVKAINRRFGYSIEFRVKDRFVYENFGNYDESMTQEPCFVFKIDLDDFKSKHELKMICYALRMCYEENGIILVNAIVEGCKTGFVKAYMEALIEMDDTGKSEGQTYDWDKALWSISDSDADIDTAFMALMEKLKVTPYKRNNTCDIMAHALCEFCDHSQKEYIKKYVKI